MTQDGDLTCDWQGSILYPKGPMFPFLTFASLVRLTVR